MKRPALLAFLLLPPALLLAADMFAQLGWNPQSFENACFQLVAEPERTPNFYATPAMRALAVVQRKAAVEAVGARAKAYFASEAFRKRWAEHRNQVTGGEERERQQDQNAAYSAQMAAQSIAQMEQMMPMVPPAQQAEMRKAIEKAKAKQSKEAIKKEAGIPPKDPKGALKDALNHFLRVTEGVDYAAATTTHQNRRYFSNQAYESKPAEWKTAFRAGREATESARAYARAWLAELK